MSDSLHALEAAAARRPERGRAASINIRMGMMPRLKGGNATSEAETALDEDFEAAALAQKKKDFPSMNIFANRLMSDAHLGSLPWAAVTGWFLKQIAYDGITARARPDALKTLEQAGSEALRSLRKEFGAQGRSEGRWKSYSEYTAAAGLALMDEFEKGAYRRHPTFVSESFTRLGELLREHQEILVDPNNMFLAGIQNEMNRLTRVHGGTERDLMFQEVLKAFAAYYGYLVLASTLPDGTVSPGPLQASLTPIVDRIGKIFLASDGKMSVPSEVVDELLAQLIFDWRKSFLFYMEQTAVQATAERKRIELPEEAKRKIAEIVSEALKREVKTE